MIDLRAIGDDETSNIRWLFLSGTRYAALELDSDGEVVALLSDRATAEEAEAWVVPPDGADDALSKIREFLGARDG